MDLVPFNFFGKISFVLEYFILFFTPQLSLILKLNKNRTLLQRSNLKTKSLKYTQDK